MKISQWSFACLLQTCIGLPSPVLALGSRHVYIGCDSQQQRMIFEEFQVANETIQTAEHILSGFLKSESENHMAHVYLKAFASQTKPIPETRRLFASYYRRLARQLDGTKGSHTKPQLVVHECNNLHPTCWTNFEIANEPLEYGDESAIKLTYCDSWFDDELHPTGYDSYVSLSTDDTCSKKNFMEEFQTLKGALCSWSMSILASYEYQWGSCSMLL